MGVNNNFNGKRPSIIGVIPQYSSNSRFNIYTKIKMPPVGIVSVLSQIQNDPRFDDIYLIDENNYVGPGDHMGMPDHKFLQELKPAGIAMFYGGMTNSVPRMFSLANQYKNFGSVTIAGGGHVQALPEEALKSGIDIVVHGEGEETAQEILEIIVQNGNINFDPDALTGVRGISILDNNGKYRFTGERKPITDLDALKDIDLTLIRHLKERWTAIPVNRGRGCNYNCEFCGVNKQLGRFRASSVEKAFKQIVKHSDMGYKEFFITDDNFAQNPSEAIEFSKMVGEYKREFDKEINIMTQSRTEIAENDELIEAMIFAGITSHAIGYESPIPEELKAMKKGVTVERMIERSRKLAKHFYLHGMFIFGYPTFKDSKYKSSLTLEQRARKYREFFKKAKLDTVQVLNAIPAPGSDLRDKLAAEKRIFPLSMVPWERYDGLFLCHDPTPEGLSPYDLQNIPKTLMTKWYTGNFINRRLNPFNAVNWAYNVLSFPIQFGLFYTKRFVHNLSDRIKEEKVIREKAGLLPRKGIFLQPLENSWNDIKRRWVNLAIKTYARGIIRGWMREYRKSDYWPNLKKYFSKKSQETVDVK
jgi:radical SAM superfamily enzyme YgiQ (UPF0313 family)